MRFALRLTPSVVLIVSNMSVADVTAVPAAAATPPPPAVAPTTDD